MKADHFGREGIPFQKGLLPLYDILACNSKATNQKSLQKSTQMNLLTLPCIHHLDFHNITTFYNSAGIENAKGNHKYYTEDRQADSIAFQF